MRSTHVVDEATKADGNVPESNDDIAPNHGILARLKDLEQEEQVRLAKVRRDTHHLRQSQRGSLPQYRRLRISDFYTRGWANTHPVLLGARTDVSDKWAVYSQEAFLAIQQLLLPYTSYEIANVVFGITSYCVQVVRVFFSGFSSGLF